MLLIQTRLAPLACDLWAGDRGPQHQVWVCPPHVPVILIPPCRWWWRRAAPSGLGRSARTPCVRGWVTHWGGSPGPSGLHAALQGLCEGQSPSGSGCHIPTTRRLGGPRAGEGAVTVPAVVVVRAVSVVWMWVPLSACSPTNRGTCSPPDGCCSYCSSGPGVSGLQVGRAPAPSGCVPPTCQLPTPVSGPPLVRWVWVQRLFGAPPPPLAAPPPAAAANRLRPDCFCRLVPGAQTSRAH